MNKMIVLFMVFLLAACSSSPRQNRAPVVESGAVPETGEVYDPDVIESSPLPPVGTIQRQPLKQSRRVSPVVKKLLQQSDQARQQQQWSQAEVYLERALRISPRNALVWHRMAMVKLQQNKFNQAIQFSSKSNTLALSDQALKRRNWQIIAQANTGLNRPAKANAARQKALAY